MIKRPWSKNEDALLKRRYATTVTRELVTLLGRSPSAIGAHAKELGLGKDPAFIAATARVRARARTGEACGKRFAPGQRPWNTGLKGTHFSPATQFKKGNRPQTWVPIGSTRLMDGYLQRKMTDNGYAPRDWRAVHVMLWERYRGPIPAGHAVIFKDKDRSHIKMANLELVSRGELMRRNSLHTNYPKEIRHLIQLRGALNRQINRRAHEKQN